MSSGKSRTRRRTKLFYAQNGKCFYCRKPMVLVGHCSKDVLPDKVTVDHVVPRAKGGGNEDNTVAAHHDCNVAKGDREPTVEEIKRMEDLHDLMNRYSAGDLRKMYKEANGITNFLLMDECESSVLVRPTEGMALRQFREESLGMANRKNKKIIIDMGWIVFDIWPGDTIERIASRHRTD